MPTAPPKTKATEPAATKTTKPAGRKPRVDTTAVSPQRLLDDLDKLRTLSGDDLRRALDRLASRVRDVVDDAKELADDRTSTIERRVTGVADDAWTQLGTLAVHGLRDSSALDELAGEIRKRKAQLRDGGGAAAAEKTT